MNGSSVPPEQLIQMFQTMALIRAFEEKTDALFALGKVHGTMHLSIGQEAVATGVCTALAPNDFILSTHRGHGHCLAHGADVRPMMAEFLGKETGYCRGRGGSMHIADVEHGNLGANGIVAGGLPIATGVGLSIHLRQSGQVCVAFFGDGAANEGAFHESLNLAATWGLPVIFVCENNQYAMSMPVKSSMQVERVSDRAYAYGMPGMTVDGMDVQAVYGAAAAAIGRARSGAGPTLLECVTYRYKGHSKSDRQRYRTQDEVEQWRRRDPIRRFRQVLADQGVLTADAADRSEAEARAAVEAAVEFAEASPEPDPARLLEGVYAASPVSGAEVKRGAPTHWISRPGTPTRQRRPEPSPAIAGAPSSPALASSAAATRELSYVEALREALSQAMQHDDRVVVLGEDIGVYGGAFGVTDGLLAQFGASRVRDTPISEAAITGCAVGAALTGLRPVLEIQFMDFMTLCMEQLVLQAAKIRYMFGGKAQVPMVVRTPAGSGTGAAAQHSESLEAWFVHVPGLNVVAPATPADAKGLLLASIRDNNPTIFVEHKLLYRTKGPVSEAPTPIPLGVAEVKRLGTDVTVIATSIMVIRALAAAERLAAEGISVEVVDPRTLSPLDVETLAASVRKTGRVVIVYEAVKTLGIGAEIAASLAEDDAFFYLQAPIVRLGGAACPIPYNRTLERAAVPQEEDIIEAVRQLMRT